MSLSGDWTDVKISWSARVASENKLLLESGDGKGWELCSQEIRVSEAVRCLSLPVSVHVNHLLVADSEMRKGKVGNRVWANPSDIIVRQMSHQLWGKDRPHFFQICSEEFQKCSQCPWAGIRDLGEEPWGIGPHLCQE